MIKNNLVGKKFNRLTVTSIDTEKSNKRTYYSCT